MYDILLDATVVRDDGTTTTKPCPVDVSCVVAISVALAKGEPGTCTQMLEEETNPFVLLNHALYEEGLFLYVPPKIESTIQWVFLTDGKAQIHSPKVELYLGKGSKLRVHSRLQGKGGYWHNGNVNAVLDEGATLTLDQRFSHGTENSQLCRLKISSLFIP